MPPFKFLLKKEYLLRAYNDKRLVIGLMAFISLALSFWYFSRYPALDVKAAMSGSLGVDGGLSFDATYDINSTANIIEKIINTLLNWIHVNEKGMLFGLALATVLLVLLPLIARKLPQGKISSIFSGLILGVPLGLCVNCSAPIAYGLYQRKINAATALTVMLSSPALNIVALTMALNILPTYIVAIKIILSLFLILFIVPFTVYLFPDESNHLVHVKSKQESFPQNEQVLTHSSWLSSIIWFAKGILIQGWWLIRKMVPLMLLAGFIGSILITFIPWEEVAENLVTPDKQSIILMVIFIALFGLLLPVPITFDIILASILYASNVPIKYVAVLLFTLGSFSIYSWFVLFSAGAKKTACVLAIAVACLGIFAGVISHYYEKNSILKNNLNDFKLLENTPKPRETIERIDSRNSKILAAPSIQWNSWQALDKNSNQAIQQPIEYFSFKKLVSTNVPKTFTFKYLSDEVLGFQVHQKLLFDQFYLPTLQVNSLASGDFNSDGWVDVIVGTVNGLYIYQNIGGKFELSNQNKVFDKFNGLTGAVALQDIDNNGWLDLIWSSHTGGYIAYNNRGQYDRIVELPVEKQITYAIAFDDVDNDGDLDIFWGQYYEHRYDLKASKNLMLYQQQGNFKSTSLPGEASSTLTALFTDVNSDGKRELLVGNDFRESDIYYSDLMQKEHHEWMSYWPLTTQTSMSLSSADIDNDLVFETYHAQITRNTTAKTIVPQTRREDYTQAFCSSTEISDPNCQALINSTTVNLAMVKNVSSYCMGLTDNDRYECLSMLLVRPNIIVDFTDEQRSEFLALCSLLEQYSKNLKNICINKANRVKRPLLSESDKKNQIPQQRKVNMLYKHPTISQLKNNQSTLNKAVNIADEMGISITGWTWNAKFADYDGDEWQDFFAVNGYTSSPHLTSNVWFKNEAGQLFTEKSEQVGLTHFNDTMSFLSLDFDNDGDLDIISFDIQGKLHGWRNEEQFNHHLQLEVKDSLGNTSGIGSKVIIYYGKNNKQIREIKASGGYQSMDSALLHFGLGEYDEINAVEILTTQKTHKFVGPFPADRRYRIHLSK